MAAAPLDDVETLPMAAYRESVAGALREQLAYVADAPFYRRKFDDAGVDPAEVTLDSFADLPFTRKDELRASQERAPPFGDHRACPPERVARVYTSSGTTGTPTFVGLTESDLDGWCRAGARAARAAGLRPADVTVGALGGGPFAGAVTYDAHRRLGATVAPVGPGNTDRIVTYFRRDCGDALLGTPSYAEYFLEQVREHDLDPAALGVERVLVGGEPGASEVRDRIEDAFGCTLTESMGNADACISIWGECERQNGMHFTAQGAVYPELIDPESGEPIAWREGATGELVYTSLDRECVPLVRFRTRDRVVVTETDCGCGRATPCIRCRGRTDDVFVVRGVNVFPSAVKDVVTDLPGTTGHLRIHLPAEGRVTAPVPVTVERTEAAPDDLAERVERALEDRLQFGADVDLVPAGTLERSQYKTDLVAYD